MAPRRTAQPTKDPASPERKGRAARSTGARPGAKGDRRQELLDIARELFARRGYHRATIEDIVAKAGVARGTFYLYFEDKRAIFAQLMDRFWSRIAMAISRIRLEDGAGSVEEQVRQNIRAVVAVCLEERAMTRILFSSAHGVDADFDRRLFTFYDAVQQLLTESLRDGQVLGIVADGEPRVMAHLTMGALKELLYQAASLGLSSESADSLTSQLFQFLSGGYLRLPVEDGSSNR